LALRSTEGLVCIAEQAFDLSGGAGHAGHEQTLAKGGFAVMELRAKSDVHGPILGWSRRSLQAGRTAADRHGARRLQG
jgi:hypothetical protein